MDDRSAEPHLPRKQAHGYLASLRANPGLWKAVKEVAAALGNTASVCRRCYIHPAVIEAFEAGSLLETLRPAKSSKDRGASSSHGLRQDETRLIRLLQAAVQPTKKAKAG